MNYIRAGWRTALRTSFAAVLVLAGCKKDDIVQPPPVKDPRTYTWTADTLAYPGSLQTNMSDIWGSSPSDVYTVGHNDQGRGKMWHFDGVRWTSVKLSSNEGGPLAFAFDLSGVYGFGRSDVWAVGSRIYQDPIPPFDLHDSSLVIHFDGTQWRDESIIRGRSLYRVWGVSPSNVWLWGNDETLYHFDGTQLLKDSLPGSIPRQTPIQFTGISGNVDNLYATGTAAIDSVGRFTYYFLRKTNQGWTLLDTFIVDATHSNFRWGVHLWMSPSKTLYSVLNGVFRLAGLQWLSILSTPSALGKITGTSDQNVFCVGGSGKVYHFNGTDWYLFNQLETANLANRSVWTDGMEVFVVGIVVSAFPQKTVVLHGK